MKKTLIIIAAFVFFAQPNLVLAKKEVGQSAVTLNVKHFDDGSHEIVKGSHDAEGKDHEKEATLFLGGLLDKAKSFVSGLFGGGSSATPAAPTATK